MGVVAGMVFQWCALPFSGGRQHAVDDNRRRRLGGARRQVGSWPTCTDRCPASVCAMDRPEVSAAALCAAPERRRRPRAPGPRAVRQERARAVLEPHGLRGPDTVETECARGSRLPRIVGGEEELGGPSLAPEQRACEMKGVERLHRRRHRQCRTSEHEACEADAIDRPFDGGERRVKGADLLVIERTLEPKAVENAPGLHAEQLARACCVPLAPDRERIRLCEHYPEHDARVQVHGHRASRSSRRRRTTSSGRLGRTRRTFLRSVTGRDAGRTSKPSFSSGSYGTSRAMGVVRSQTTTDSPLRTSARYALRWTFRSDTMALFMVSSWSDLVLIASAESRARSPEEGDALPGHLGGVVPHPRR